MVGFCKIKQKVVHSGLGHPMAVLGCLDFMKKGIRERIFLGLNLGQDRLGPVRKGET